MTAGTLLTAVDIGTTKICVLSAEMTERGTRVIAEGRAPARGLKKGVVVNLDEAADAIKTAMGQAETVSGRKIRNAFISISGRHITGFPSNGVIGLRGGEIGPEDVLSSLDSAKTMYLPLDREMLHVVPTEFVLDGQEGITDPVGMSGVRLESRVYIITAQTQAMQNLAKACALAGLQVADMVFGPIASAQAVLTHDELQRGAVLIDIGGGTTDIAVFRDGALVHASVLGIGGLHITNDLAVCLKIRAEEAEKLKTSIGSAISTGMAKQETTEPSLFGDAEQSRQQLAAIIRPRCEELFGLVRRELAKSSPARTPVFGVVLTGGTALLNNVAVLAASVLGAPARIGMPQGVSGMKHGMRDPAYAAGIGLLIHAYQRELEDGSLQDMAGIFSRMKSRLKKLSGYKDFIEMLHKKKKGVSYV